MNCRKAYQYGYVRGWNVASWVDIPEIGYVVPRELDWEGIGTISTRREQIEAWNMLVHESESNDRSFSPFECTASEINNCSNSELVWEWYDRGIAAGIAANRKSRFPLNRATW